MGRRHILTALLLAATLGACAELTAEAPLFAPADQIGPAPLSEGIWITLQEGCPDSFARRPHRALSSRLHAARTDAPGRRRLASAPPRRSHLRSFGAGARRECGDRRALPAHRRAGGRARQRRRLRAALRRRNHARERRRRRLYGHRPTRRKTLHKRTDRALDRLRRHPPRRPEGSPTTTQYARPRAQRW